MCRGKACAVFIHQYGIVLGKYTHVIIIIFKSDYINERVLYSIVQNYELFLLS